MKKDNLLACEMDDNALTKEDSPLVSKLDTIVAEVEGSARSWFVKAFQYLTTKLSSMKGKLDDNIDNVKQEMVTQVNKLETKINQLEDENTEQG